LETPAAASLQLSIEHAQFLRKAATSVFSERDIGFEPTTSSLGSRTAEQFRSNCSNLGDRAVVGDDELSPSLPKACSVSVLSFSARASAADEALKAYLFSLANSIAATLPETPGWS
jgi:hypothetical protein